MYNKGMQKDSRRRSGFTVVEVTLVLAISTALAMAILSTIMGNIYRRRFVDSYTDFANYLRSAYSSTINVQIQDSIQRKPDIHVRLIHFGMKMVILLLIQILIIFQVVVVVQSMAS